MATVYCICGKICVGKTRYARELARRETAVILSCDELDGEIFHHNLGAAHDRVMADVHRYLHRKAIEIARAGASVVLDWGFWRAQERERVSAMYREAGVPFEWHAVRVSDADWARNIAERNARVKAGECGDYFVDDGLLEKLLRLFEEPKDAQMDVIVDNRR